MIGSGLPPAWTQLRFHLKQHEFWTSTNRFKALACGRGSGKTELSRRYIVRMLPVRKPWPDPIYFYALPTYNQAKRVAWVKLLDLIPKHWIDSKNVNELTITTKFGSTLYVVGMDNPARIEGSQYDGGVIDESSDIKPGVFDRSILPALAHRKGFCYRIGVPKRFGIGASEFKEFFDKGLKPNKEEIISWTWPSTDIMTPEEIAIAKKVLSVPDFAEQYEASWESVGGLIFFAFSESKQCSSEVQYNPDLPIYVGSDFNVDPMCWCLAHRYGKSLHFFDEVVLRNTNTQKTLNYLHEQYGGHASGWEFFGDAAGRHRKTSAVTTDYIQIRNDRRFDKPGRKKIHYPMKNPVVQNRFAATNALLLSADEEVRCYIHPRCERLIKDLKMRAYKEGTREPDDALDMGHMSDAMGYMVYRLFPVRGNMFSSDYSQGKIIIAA